MMISRIAMMSLKGLARDLSCQPATVNANRTLVYPCLTMVVRQPLTKKIYPVLTINVPLSFVFKTESATRAA
jgi:hypothetical protein